eukprot:14306384-Heterocapsa_arctica.AAC.1
MDGGQKALPEGPWDDAEASTEVDVVLVEASREVTALDPGPYGGDGLQTWPEGADPSSGARAPEESFSVAPVQ